MSASGLNPRRLWLFVFLLVLILLVFQEVLFRLVFPLPEILNFNRINYSMMVSGEPQIRSRPLANEAYSWASDPDGVEFIHHLNLYGFRDQTWPVEYSGRVMFVGDSFVEGFMASDDETIPSGFETAAAKTGKPLQTINLGTGASGIADYLAVIRDAVPIFRPQLVVLVLYANDFPADQDVGRHLDNGEAAVRDNNYLPRLYVVVSRMIRGEPVATRWHKQPFPFLPTADSSRSPLSNEGFRERVNGFVSPRILSFMKQGRFNPFVINEYTNYELHLKRPLKIEGVIEKTMAFVEAHGAHLMIVHIPYRSQVSDHYLDYAKQFDKNKQPHSLMPASYQVHAKFLKTECERLAIPYLDMTAILRQRESSGERMYWDYDEHMKGSTYLLVGEEIYQAWESPVGLP